MKEVKRSRYLAQKTAKKRIWDLPDIPAQLRVFQIWGTKMRFSIMISIKIQTFSSRRMMARR